MPLPRDFLDEVEMELTKARRSLTHDRGRIAAIDELYRVAFALSDQLGRPLTVFDLIRSADTERERERRLALVRQLRGDPEQSERKGGPL